MRFVSFFATCVVILGLSLHFGIAIPWVGHWLGHLPGDLLLHRGDLSLYVPFTSAFLLSVVGSLFLR